MKTEQKTVSVKGKGLSLEQVRAVALEGARVQIPDSIRRKIAKNRSQLEQQIRDFPEIAIYGTNRLHGDLKDIPVPLDAIAEYQVKYIKVHNCGTGAALTEAEVRGIMLIRLNSFAKAMSGISLAVCDQMVDMLNAGLSPWILEEGSVGASGDLVPLAMMGATMIALPESKAWYKGKLMDGPKALKAAGIEPLVLGAKEAMGITNGSNFMASIAALAALRAENIMKNASICAALSLEAIRGEKIPFDALINEQSDRHEGQLAIARHLRALLKGSKRTSLAAQRAAFGNRPAGAERVQDRYSFRAVPQIHGAAWEALLHLKKTLEVEINSATDNPLFDFAEKDKSTGGVKFASGANFHGQALATVVDYLKLAITSVGLVSDKRAFSLLDKNLNFGLPADLAQDTHKADGGLMITQYAGAARAAENRVLSSPASVMSVSTAANQEDFVSMGSLAVLHLKKILQNLETLLGIELLCATRALQLTQDWLPSKLAKLGTETSKIHKFASQQEQLGTDTSDHYLRHDMEKAREIIASGILLSLIKPLK